MLVHEQNVFKITFLKTVGTMFMKYNNTEVGT